MRRTGRANFEEEVLKPAKEESKVADVVVVVAAVCLAVIGTGLVFADTRRFAIEFGSLVFLILVAAGIGVLGYVGWIIIKHARQRRQMDGGLGT